MEGEGEENCEPAAAALGRRSHGVVRAVGTHFEYEDGLIYKPFGTTVYALMHQDEELIRTTFQSLAAAPWR